MGRKKKTDLVKTEKRDRNRSRSRSRDNADRRRSEKSEDN